MRNNANRLLGLVGATAVILTCGRAVTASGGTITSYRYVSMSSPSYSIYSSMGCLEWKLGDSSCDTINNNAECGYDGGDCCECTCQYQSDDYARGCAYDGNPFACIDPDAPCVDDDDITADIVENCGSPSGIGDGYCLGSNNKEECGYDGGDCCECTCVSPDDYDSCSETTFACIDPNAACVDDDDVTSMVEHCVVSWLGDGLCDQSNNNEICGYDGGDCCECTCVSEVDDADSCASDFACIDPAAPCVGDDDITTDMVENCGDITSVGDGTCDMENNNELCGFDGGDCCECTCVPSVLEAGSSVGCEYGFACVDPNASCFDGEFTLDMAENCDDATIGNGYCNFANNNAFCGYDGGDCCECTCEDALFLCGESRHFACIDPEAECVDDDLFTEDMMDDCSFYFAVGDGECDNVNNIEECAYDGGDCCPCTCQSVTGDACDESSSEYSCVDPNAPCVEDDDITIDMLENCESVSDIGDGYCSRDLNTEECAYDGGDCCPCTCQNDADNEYKCVDFACVDPAAPCVDDDSVTADLADLAEQCEDLWKIGDAWCDTGNNNEACGYDGGDCCECTCENPENLTGRCTFFACVDPDAACVDDDDVTAEMAEVCGKPTEIGDGNCNVSNNKEECDYDGGDCCRCTSNGPDIVVEGWGSGPAFFDCKDPSAECFGEESSSFSDDYGDHGDSNAYDDGSISYSLGSWDQTDQDDSGAYNDDSIPSAYVYIPSDQTEPLPTVAVAYEVGTMTEVSVSATAHDTRPGSSSGDDGCGEAGGDGCAAANAHDDIISDIESRWSCAKMLVPDEGPCQIEFSFAEPQDIVDIQVAFWKGNERTRTLDVYTDGELTHTHESYADSTFNTLGVTATEASTVMLESVHLLSDEWISLLEVQIFVEV